MAGSPPRSSPSPFAVEWVAYVARALETARVPRRALDLAMGEGRHAALLADAGFATFGVDRATDRLLLARRALHGLGRVVTPWAADLDHYPLPVGWVDLLFCTRFLLRHRWADLKALVRPGGFVIYETFTREQRDRGAGPSSPDHLLVPGELREAFADWETVFHEEVTEPAAVARLVARKAARP